MMLSRQASFEDVRWSIRNAESARVAMLADRGGFRRWVSAKSELLSNHRAKATMDASKANDLGNFGIEVGHGGTTSSGGGQSGSR